MLLLSEQILVELSQALSIDLADLTAGHWLFPLFHILILIVAIISRRYWLTDGHVTHSSSVLWSPVARWRPLIIVSICALLCIHNIVIFSLLSLYQIHLKCRIAVSLLAHVSGDRLHVAHWTLIEEPRYHRIHACLAGLEALQIGPVQTLFHLGHGTLLL